MVNAADTRRSDTGEDRLAGEVRALQPGDHLCLIYDDDPAQQLPALLPFLQQGIEDGERCLYVADDQAVDDLRSALAAYGVDVERETRRGALLLWTRDEWRQPGELDLAKKAAQVRDIIDGAMEAGFRGVRMGVEMTWTLGPDIDVETLRHWEATVNTVFAPGVPVRIICQYSRRRLAPDLIGAALSTHPVAVLGTEVCPNPYYETPLLLDGAVPRNGMSPARVDWMISQLRWARAYEKERKQRVRAESALEEAEDSRRTLQTLYDSVQAALEDLRRENATKDEFLGLVSHELRTPITVILGNAQVLLKALQIPSEGHYGALLDINSEAERLNRIISNLLVLARLEGGRAPETEPVLVNQIVERMAEQHRARYPGRVVNVACPAVVIPSLGNELYIEQILANLLSNAEKYSPTDAPIEVELVDLRDLQRVTVRDRGIGIAGEDPQRPFEAFYRSPEASQLGPGIGIGLAVCKRLVEAQGGEIRASAREGGGAEFAFTLRHCEAR